MNTLRSGAGGALDDDSLVKQVAMARDSCYCLPILRHGS